MEKDENGKGLMYEVPEELKYEERVFWLFTMKQAAIFCSFLLVAILFFTRTGFNMEIRLAISSAIVFSGFIIASFKQFQDDAVRRIKYMLSPKRGSWTDPEVLNNYVNIQSIPGSAVLMQDGRMLGILLVTPIDFSILSDDQKYALVYCYKQFLNSLSFPVQVVMRTTKINLQEYFASAKAQIALKRDKKAMEEMEKFQEFVEDYVATKGVNDRLFYVIIPQETTGKFHQDSVELTNKVNICKEKLSLAGLNCKLLNDSSLITLYASFFGGYVEVEADYLSLLTMLEMASGEYENLKKAGNKVDAKAILYGGRNETVRA
jgi:hypothetical protein